MNDRQKLAERAIFHILLALPADERAAVWLDVSANNVFCVHCGYGDPAFPNPNCHCQNDE